VLNLLARLPQGRLDLQLPDGQVQRLPGGRRQRPARGSMVLHNWAVFERTLKAGDIGLAESYIDGDWDSPDLAALLRLCIRNREHIEGLSTAAGGARWSPAAPPAAAQHPQRQRQEHPRPLRPGQQLLPPVAGPDHELQRGLVRGPRPARVDLQAQQAKVRRALREARVTGARVLEIGCGWGGLAEIAAGEFGAHVTGVTLSREQLQWGQARMQALGLGRQVDLRYQDYRDLAERRGRPSTPSSPSRCSRPWAANTGAATSRPCAPASSPAACLHPDHHHPRRPVRALCALDRLHPAVHLPRRPAAQPSAFEAEARRRLRRRAAPGLRPDYAETLRRWREAFLRRSTRCSAWASTPASSASGPSTWPTARRPSTPATPTSSSSRCASPCHDIRTIPALHPAPGLALARMAGMLATLPVTLSPP
jgi:cyclopropane-fatty-acyl-phospholipid synthase